jgi:hypothetical protein
MLDVRIPHPEYAAAKLSIMAARDAYLGERAIKDRADLYLPRLSGQKVEDYAAYKMRAMFYSIVGRTVQALTGLAVQGEIAKKGNDEILNQMKEALHGLQLFELHQQTVAELLLQGRIGILLDAPDEASTVGIYFYVSDSIINWSLDGMGRPIYIVLHETRLVQDQSNRFKQELENQYRVLTMENNVYTVTLYDKNSNQLQRIQPTFRGKTLDHIPFSMAMPEGLRFGMSKSPMEDMVNVNLSHYRTSADLEHGRHIAGIPTPVVSGSEVGSRLKIGGTAAWVLPDEKAKAYYMEFKGEGLKSLEKALEEKEKQLTSLSSSIISRSIRGSESPDAIRLRMSSETASLFSVVKTTESLFNFVYNEKARLEGHEPDIELSFPTSFVSGTLSADEIAKYSEVYLSGGLPLVDYLNILRRGGTLAASRSDEEVKRDLEQVAKDLAAAAKEAAKPKQPTQT